MDSSSAAQKDTVSDAGPASAPRVPGLTPRSERRGPGTYDRTQSTEERHEQQRRQLVAAAQHVFGRDGYARASVATILEVAGLSRGTFYRHFRDLRQVFLAAQAEAAELMYRTVEEAFHAAEDPPAKQRACIRAYLDFVLRYADLARVFHREAAVGGEEYAALRRENLSRMVGLWRAGLEEARSLGLIERIPDELSLYALVVAIEGVAMLYLEEYREGDVMEAVPVLERLCLRVVT